MVHVRLLRPIDLPDVAQIHLAAFKESALGRLGHEAVRRYYEWLLTGPHKSVALGAWAREAETGREKLIGFCFGGRFHGALSGFVRKNRWFLARVVVMRPWLAANPLFRERLAQAARILRLSKLFARRKPSTRARKPNPEHSTQREPTFGILAIAVHPYAQGMGAGKHIMREAERAARAGGYNLMNLTVHPDNVQAVGFYERLGWQKTPLVPGGTWEGTMLKSIPSMDALRETEGAQA
jgi:ribosomal protein S18 acetylase RimI-like enzyme